MQRLEPTDVGKSTLGENEQGKLRKGGKKEYAYMSVLLFSYISFFIFSVCFVSTKSHMNYQHNQEIALFAASL